MSKLWAVKRVDWNGAISWADDPESYNSKLVVEDVKVAAHFARMLNRPSGPKQISYAEVVEVEIREIS